MRGLLSTLVTLLVAGAGCWMDRTLPDGPSILALLLAGMSLEVLAVPLVPGFFSPALAVTVAGAALPGVGVRWALLVTGMILTLRALFRGNRDWRLRALELLIDLVPAALGAGFVQVMGLLPALPLIALDAWVLPLLLTTAWVANAPAIGLRDQLAREHLALSLLGPVAALLHAAHPLAPLLTLPIGAGLMHGARVVTELARNQAFQFDVSRKNRGLMSREREVVLQSERQAQLQRLLDARAQAFSMLERLSGSPQSEQQATQEILQSLADQIPNAACAMYMGEGSQLRLFLALGNVPPAEHPPLARAWQKQLPWFESGPQQSQAVWPLPERGVLWVGSRTELSSETAQVMGVFLHYAGLILDRVRFQASLASAWAQESSLRMQLSLRVDLLRVLLEASSQVARETQPRALVEAAVSTATRLTGGRTCGARIGDISSGSPWSAEALNLKLAGGTLWVHDPAGLDLTVPEALDLWGRLVSAALERSQAQSHLAQASKLAGIGQLAAGVAHELNTPMGAISVALSSARGALEKRPQKVASKLEVAQRSLEQMKRIVAQLLQYSRDFADDLAVVDLAHVARESCRFSAHGFEAAGVSLTLVAPQEVNVLANSSELQQVLLNLLSNAREAGARRVATRVLASQHQALVEVEDDGPGIAPEVAERVFEPFFTTKDVGQGVGLGLSTSREILRQHQGQLDYTPSTSGGAKFVLRLPLAVP